MALPVIIPLAVIGLAGVGIAFAARRAAPPTPPGPSAPGAPLVAAPPKDVKDAKANAAFVSVTNAGKKGDKIRVTRTGTKSPAYGMRRPLEEGFRAVIFGAPTTQKAATAQEVVDALKRLAKLGRDSEEAYDKMKNREGIGAAVLSTAWDVTTLGMVDMKDSDDYARLTRQFSSSKVEAWKAHQAAVAQMKKIAVATSMVHSSTMHEGEEYDWNHIFIMLPTGSQPPAVFA